VPWTLTTALASDRYLYIPAGQVVSLIGCGHGMHADCKQWVVKDAEAQWRLEHQPDTPQGDAFLGTDTLSTQVDDAAAKVEPRCPVCSCHFGEFDAPGVT